MAKCRMANEVKSQNVFKYSCSYPATPYIHGQLFQNPISILTAVWYERRIPNNKEKHSTLFKQLFSIIV